MEVICEYCKEPIKFKDRAASFEGKLYHRFCWRNVFEMKMKAKEFHDSTFLK